MHAYYWAGGYTTGRGGGIPLPTPSQVPGSCDPYYWVGAVTTGRERVGPLTQSSAQLMSPILLGGLMGGLPTVSYMHTEVTQLLLLLVKMYCVRFVAPAHPFRPLPQLGGGNPNSTRWPVACYVWHPQPTFGCA